MSGELRTLIILAGGKRLPDLEDEILASKSLSVLYLNNIFETLQPSGRIPELESRIFADFNLTRKYLGSVLGARHFQTSSWANFASAVTCHAMHTQNSPWPEAEHIILCNPYYSYRYAMSFGRWAKAEAVILNNGGAELACWYAIDVIGGRWPEAESLIMQDKTYRELYMQARGQDS